MDKPGDERYILGLIDGFYAVEPRDELALEGLLCLLRREQEARVDQESLEASQ